MRFLRSLEQSVLTVLVAFALTATLNGQSTSPAQNRAQGPAKVQAAGPVTMTECEGTDNCATWTFLGTQGNGQWPSGDMANLIVEHFDSDSVVIRRADSTGASAGLTAVYKGTRKGNRLGGEFTSSWPGHWANQEGYWYATIQRASISPPAVMRVCDAIRCGTLTWDNGLYDAVWSDIPHVATVSVVSFSPDSVIMNTTDHTNGNTYVSKGKISSEGDSIIDGEVRGTNNGYVGRFSAYWGAALRDHPPMSAPVQRQPTVIVPVVCYPWFFGVVCG